MIDYKYRDNRSLRGEQLDRTIGRVGAVLYIILAVVAFVLFGLFCSMELEDQKADEANYCEMVRGGHWAAYRHGVDCGEVKK